MKQIKVPKARKLPSGSYECRVRSKVYGYDESIVRPTAAEAERIALGVKQHYIEAARKAADRPLTVSQAIDQYIDSKSNILSPATIRGYRIIQEHRLQTIMQKPVASITRTDVQQAINADAKDYSVKTLKNSFGLLRAVLADNDVRIDLDRISMPTGAEPEKPIYTEAEQRKLLQAVAGTDVEIPVLLAMWLGLRRSEILGLKWTDVDFKGQTIRVHAALVQDENNDFVEKGTKTAKSTRTLPVPDYVLDALRRADRKSERVVPMSPQTIRNHMVRLCEAAGLPFYGLHRLRHTNASVMLRLGVPNKYARERGGWSTDKTMTEIYQHTMDEGRAEAAAAVDTYFGSLTAEKTPRKYRLVKGRLPGQK